MAHWLIAFDLTQTLNLCASCSWILSAWAASILYKIHFIKKWLRNISYRCFFQSPCSDLNVSWYALWSCSSLVWMQSYYHHHSHDAWDITDGHRSIVSPALSLLILAAVGLLTGRRVVGHFDRRAAGFLALPQLSELFGQSRQILQEDKFKSDSTLFLHFCKSVVCRSKMIMQ